MSTIFFAFRHFITEKYGRRLSPWPPGLTGLALSSKDLVGFQERNDSEISWWCQKWDLIKIFFVCFMLLKQICRRRLYLKTGLWWKMSPAYFILCFGSSCLNKSVKGYNFKMFQMESDLSLYYCLLFFVHFYVCLLFVAVNRNCGVKLFCFWVLILSNYVNVVKMKFFSQLCVFKTIILLD